MFSAGLAVLSFGFADVNPAFLGTGGGVDAIGPLRHTLVQHAPNRGVAQQFGLPSGEPSAVANRNLLQTTRNRIGQKCSELFREGEIWFHLRVLLVVDRKSTRLNSSHT